MGGLSDPGRFPGRLPRNRIVSCPDRREAENNSRIHHGQPEHEGSSNFRFVAGFVSVGHHGSWLRSRDVLVRDSAAGHVLHLVHVCNRNHRCRLHPLDGAAETCQHLRSKFLQKQERLNTWTSQTNLNFFCSHFRVSVFLFLFRFQSLLVPVSSYSNYSNQWVTWANVVWFAIANAPWERPAILFSPLVHSHLNTPDPSNKEILPIVIPYTRLTSQVAKNGVNTKNLYQTCIVPKIMTPFKSWDVAEPVIERTGTSNEGAAIVFLPVCRSDSWKSSNCCVCHLIGSTMAVMVQSCERPNSNFVIIILWI